MRDVLREQLDDILADCIVDSLEYDPPEKFIDGRGEIRILCKRAEPLNSQICSVCGGYGYLRRASAWSFPKAVDAYDSQYSEDIPCPGCEAE